MFYVLFLFVNYSCISSLKRLVLHSVIYSSDFFRLLKTARILQSLFLIPGNLRRGFLYMCVDGYQDESVLWTESLGGGGGQWTLFFLFCATFLSNALP